MRWLPRPRLPQRRTEWLRQFGFLRRNYVGCCQHREASSLRISQRHAGPGVHHSDGRKKTTALAGSANTERDFCGSSDGARICSADSGRRLLCAFPLEQVLPAVRDLVHRSELAGRQPRRDLGSVSQPPATAIRILCGPHGRYLRCRLPNVRPCPLRISALANCCRNVDRVSGSLDRVLSGDVHPGEVPHGVCAVRAHGNSHSADDRQHRAHFSSPCTPDGSRVLVIRCGRRNRNCGNDGNGSRRHHRPYRTSLPGGTSVVSESQWWQSATRWMKFNLVGGLGIAVQLWMLWLLTACGVGYMLATALAVESAVLHNFFWHERFTWVDRVNGCLLQSVTRLLRFNLSAGAVSIVGNLVLMRLLVGQAHLRPMLANLIAIAACSVLNFIVSDRWVFRALRTQ